MGAAPVEGGGGVVGGGVVNAAANADETPGPGEAPADRAAGTPRWPGRWSARSCSPAAPGLSRAGQVAVVTGGSAGLGLAIATALAQAGGSASCWPAGPPNAAPRPRPGCPPGPGAPCTAMPATSLASAPSQPHRGGPGRARPGRRAGDQRRHPGPRHPGPAQRPGAAGLPGSQRGGHLAGLPRGRRPDSDAGPTEILARINRDDSRGQACRIV